MPQFPTVITLSSIDGSNGFRIAGTPPDNLLAIAGAGDVNGDGFADLIIGSYTASNFDGVTYVVFGKASGFAANLDFSNLTGSNGFKILGGPGDYAGALVASAGDVNGDGFDDVIIGAPGHTANGHWYSGAAYVVFGKASGFAATLPASSLNGSNGFKIGLYNVASAGDINGDGFADLVIGDIYGSGSGGYASGISYVVFGKASGFSAALDYSHLNGSNGFQISGEAPGDFSGFSVGSAGDVNGDGFDDLIIGAPNADPNGNASGSVYVVYRKASGFPANLSLSDLNGGNGFEIAGTGSLNAAGLSLSSAGDVNGDGTADLIIGVANGASYVVFGRS